MSIGTALLACLHSVERPGDFCAGGLRDIVMPTIDVRDVGRIAFPILSAQAAQLVAAGEAAPYGRGDATMLDPDVRRTWQIDPSRIRIGGHRWEKTLAGLVAEAAGGLGVGEPVAADFYKLLVYDTGSFFVGHRDTEKVPGMFATLVITLPSEYGGGELLVRHLGRETTLALHPEEPSEIGFAAFYADCVHEVRPLTAGFRVALVYNLCFPGRKKPLTAPDYRREEARAAALLREWADSGESPDKLVLPLEHEYTPAEISFATLKGADAAVASVLTKATAAADCDLHLALVSIDESGSAEYTGDYRPHRWGRADEDDEDEEGFEVSEVCDRELTLSQWRRPDGEDAAFENFPFIEEELCPSDAFEDLAPDEEHFHEATGNEGASFERTYRRAGLILWPRVRRLAVLNQAGLGATLPYLADLTTRWEESGGRDSSLWREADQLARHVLRSWPCERWHKVGDSDASRMLGLLTRLGNRARVETFLAEISAKGIYGAADNQAIVAALAVLSPRRATELLVSIINRNALAHIGGLGDLARRCIEASPVPIEDPARIGTALLDVLPGGQPRHAANDAWERPEPVTSHFVVDLLTATSRIDEELAVRAIEHLLAWPRTYRPDEVLIPAALSFAKQAESTAWPAVAQLRAAALAHLQKRIALPLEAPRDWRRANPVRCSCADCRELGAFLADPHQQQWLFKAAQSRRSHVADNIRNASCDLDLKTERRGSPHTLIATKNQASYERRVQQRRQDLAHASALGG